MSIIDQIKADINDAAVRGQFERLARSGALTEKQVAYGKSLYRDAFRAKEAARAEGAARTGLKRGTWVTTPNAEDGECSVWEVIGDIVTVQTEDAKWLTFNINEVKEA